MGEILVKTSNLEEVNKYVNTSKKMLAAIITDADDIEAYCIIKNESVFQEKSYWNAIRKYLLTLSEVKGILSQMYFIKEKDLQNLDVIYVMAQDIDTLIEE